MADLEDLYREIILDHYRSPRNRGEIPDPPAHQVRGYNPLCGDEILVSMVVEGDRLVDIKIEPEGCSISLSSASLMSGAVKGKTLDEVRALMTRFKTLMSVHEATLDDPTGGEPGSGDEAGAGREAGGPDVLAGEAEPVDLESLGELAALQGVVKYPVRIKCATLGWNTLAQGLAELADASS